MSPNTNLSQCCPLALSCKAVGPNSHLFHPVLCVGMWAVGRERWVWPIKIFWVISFFFIQPGKEKRKTKKKTQEYYEHYVLLSFVECYYYWILIKCFIIHFPNIFFFQYEYYAINVFSRLWCRSLPALTLSNFHNLCLAVKTSTTNGDIIGCRDEIGTTQGPHFLALFSFWSQSFQSYHINSNSICVRP